MFYPPCQSVIRDEVTKPHRIPLRSGDRLSKNQYFRELCRGDHRSPAEKHSFSDFPQENKRVFALRPQILLRQNLRAGRCPAPTDHFLTYSNRPEHFVPGGEGLGYAPCSSIALRSFRFMLRRMGLASTMVSASAAAWTEPTPYAPRSQAMGYRMGRKQLP